MRPPMLIHVPHSSLAVPADIRKEILLEDTGLEAEMLKLTDRYTDQLFGFPGIEAHVNEFNRIVFDPERFRSDLDEIMARAGMGAIYTQTIAGKPMRNISESRREELMRRFYDPYHSLLEKKNRRASPAVWKMSHS